MSEGTDPTAQLRYAADSIRQVALWIAEIHEVLVECGRPDLAEELDEALKTYMPIQARMTKRVNEAVRALDRNREAQEYGMLEPATTG